MSHIAQYLCLGNKLVIQIMLSLSYWTHRLSSVCCTSFCYQQLLFFTFPLLLRHVCMWEVSWVDHIHTVNEPTGSGNKQLSDKVIILYLVLFPYICWRHCTHTCGLTGDEFFNLYCSLVCVGKWRWWQQDGHNMWKKQEIYVYMFFIGNSMQKDNKGDREIDVRIILKCLSEKGQVPLWAWSLQIAAEYLLLLEDAV